MQPDRLLGTWKTPLGVVLMLGGGVALFATGIVQSSMTLLALVLAPLLLAAAALLIGTSEGGRPV